MNQEVDENVAKPAKSIWAAAGRERSEAAGEQAGETEVQLQRTLGACCSFLQQTEVKTRRFPPELR